jgi:hypothetical protein
MAAEGERVWLLYKVGVTTTSYGAKYLHRLKPRCMINEWQSRVRDANSDSSYEADMDTDD